VFKRRRVGFLLVAIFLTLGSCSLSGLASHLIGHYEGTLPCADCPGILMTLELKEKGRYESKLVYLERNAHIVENGYWRITGSGPNKIVELTSDDSKAKTLLLLKNNTTLHVIDSDKKPVPGSELKKQVY
jgi:uncharacterized lipoprotein NlpE involved in copper resistance